MFGDKQRRIEYLEAENAELRGAQQEIDALQPWIGLARTIKEETARYAATTDVDTAVNLAVQGASEEQRQNFVLAAFNQLAPERQLEMLATTFGDGIIKEALESERQKRTSQLEAENNLSDVLEEARQHHRLRFANIPPDAKVEMYFYEADTLDNIGAVKLRDKEWARRVCGVMGDDGYLAVLNDTVNPLIYTGTEIDRLAYMDHQRLKPAIKGDPASPLYYGSGVHVPRAAAGSTMSSMNADLGPVIINGIDIFGVLAQENN